MRCTWPVASGGKCGAFARVESGGAICQRGHCLIHPRILPRDHPLSGWDAFNRIRQQHTDAVFCRPGRAREFMAERLEQMEELEEYIRRRRR